MSYYRRDSERYVKVSGARDDLNRIQFLSKTHQKTVSTSHHWNLKLGFGRSGSDVPGGDFSGAARLLLVFLAVRAFRHRGGGGDILKENGGDGRTGVSTPADSTAEKRKVSRRDANVGVSLTLWK